MYRLSKPKGYNELITIENTETSANVVIGRISVEVLDILKADEGKDTSSADFSMKDEWDFEIKDETARKITATAMKMKKPTRAKAEPKEKKEIDALDVLLGLASYK